MTLPSAPGTPGLTICLPVPCVPPFSGPIFLSSINYSQLDNELDDFHRAPKAPSLRGAVSEQRHSRSGLQDSLSAGGHLGQQEGTGAPGHLPRCSNSDKRPSHGAGRAWFLDVCILCVT